MPWTRQGTKEIGPNEKITTQVVDRVFQLEIELEWPFGFRRTADLEVIAYPAGRVARIVEQQGKTRIRRPSRFEACNLVLSDRYHVTSPSSGLAGLAA